MQRREGTNYSSFTCFKRYCIRMLLADMNYNSSVEKFMLKDIVKIENTLRFVEDFLQNVLITIGVQ